MLFQTRTNWTKLNLEMGHMSLNEPPDCCASLSRWICSLMSLCSSSSCLDPSSLKRAIWWKQTQNTVMCAGRHGLLSLYLTIWSPGSNTSQTFWTVPPSGHGIHPTLPTPPTFLSHKAINSRPWRTLNTCPDSTQRHARYFYSSGVSEQSAPSHATSPNGFADNYEITVYVK